MDKAKIIRFDELREGDKVIGSNGEPVLVEKVYDTHMPKTMYEIEMEDGQRIECSGNHLWYTETEKDLSEKEDYYKDFLAYATVYSLPEYSKENAHYPFEVFVDNFSSDELSRRAISRVLLSMGHAGETPNVFFDGFEYLSETMIKLYSVNSFIEFTQSMLEGYFFYGKVRTTDEMFRIIDENGYNINIPEREDVVNDNKE